MLAAFSALRTTIHSAVTVVVVVVALTHHYNAVRRHRTGSNNCVLPPLFSMHGIVRGSSWMEHTLAVRRSDMLPVRTFGFLERRQAVGPLAVLIPVMVNM